MKKDVSSSLWFPFKLSLASFDFANASPGFALCQATRFPCHTRVCVCSHITKQIPPKKVLHRLGSVRQKQHPTRNSRGTSGVTRSLQKLINLLVDCLETSKPLLEAPSKGNWLGTRGQRPGLFQGHGGAGLAIAPRELGHLRLAGRTQSPFFPRKRVWGWFSRESKRKPLMYGLYGWHFLI